MLNDCEIVNSKLSKSNSTGSKNVSYEAGINKFIVTISVKKKFAYVGYFDDLELADLVAHMAREKYHGAYANHGVTLARPTEEQLNG